MSVPNHKLEKMVIAILSVGFVIWSAAFIYNSSFIAIDGKRYFSLFDDAMISMRYAWNFSHGFGLVWNPGEYVQGYTNLLMTLLMTIPTLLLDKSSAVLSIQILGVGFMLAIAFVNMKISDHVVSSGEGQDRSFIRILAFLCALAYYPLVYWSLMGMETGLLAFLLLSGILFSFDFIEGKNSSRLFLATGCLGLAFLTRNDSLIFTLLIFAYIFIELMGNFHIETNGIRRLPDRQANKSFFIAGGLYLVFVVAQSAFQYFYYGDLLPNTYTLKLTGLPVTTRILNGIGFITPFLGVSAFILVISLLGLVFYRQKRKNLLFLILLGTFIYQIYVGGDAWNYWRMLAPEFPLLTLLFISALDSFFTSISKCQAAKNFLSRNSHFPQKLLINSLMTVFVLFGLFLSIQNFWQEVVLTKQPFQAPDNAVNINTAILISKLTTSDASVGVIWAGSIPYYSGRRAVDFLGKSDRYIASLPPHIKDKPGALGLTSVPGHNKYDLNYSINILKPTYVQTFKWGVQDVSSTAGPEYTGVEIEGISLFFLKNSPAVLWEKIASP